MKSLFTIILLLGFTGCGEKSTDTENNTGQGEVNNTAAADSLPTVDPPFTEEKAEKLYTLRIVGGNPELQTYSPYKLTVTANGKTLKFTWESSFPLCIAIKESEFKTLSINAYGEIDELVGSCNNEGNGEKCTGIPDNYTFLIHGNRIRDNRGRRIDWEFYNGIVQTEHLPFIDFCQKFQ